MDNRDILLNLRKTLVGRDFDMSNLTDDVLELEIEMAIGTINRCRNFTPTKKAKYDKKYEYLIIPMCLSSLAKIGAEGETNHSENGISRTYGSDGNYPAKLLQQIIPLVK